MVAVTVITVAAIAGLVLLRGGTAVPTLGTATQVSAELPGLKMQPAISNDGEWVAYVSGSTLRGKIYVRRIGGGRPIALTDDTVNVEQEPQFSPDGKRVLFLSHGGVSVAPAQGGPTEALVPGPGIVSALWSPRGDGIAFVRDDSLLVRGPGNDAVRLVVYRPSIHGCAWAPDGALFACIVGLNNYVVPNGSFGNHSPTAIVTIPASGGSLTFVTDSSGFNLSPVWGPRHQLYFVRDQNHQRDIFVVVISADGHARSNPARVSSGLGVLALGLTPDGKHLVYTKYASRANIWALPITSDKVLSISDAVPVTTGDQTIEAMRVSRDGKWLVFDSDLPGTPNIFRVPVAGGTPEQLTRDSTQDFAGDLSPDGKEVAFHSWRTGTRDIFVLPLDGRPVQQITSTPGSESFPVWAPDGSALAYVDQQASSCYIARRLPNGGWDKPVMRMAGCFPTDWSPDSRFLLSLTRANDGALVMLPADSGTGRQVASISSLPGPLGPTGVHLSPDGSTIYLKANHVDTTLIWSMPAPGGAPRLLARLADPVRVSSRVDFAVDRKRLYVTLTERQSDLWVVDLKKK